MSTAAELPGQSGNSRLYIGSSLGFQIDFLILQHSLAPGSSILYLAMEIHPRYPGHSSWNSCIVCKDFTFYYHVVEVTSY